MPEAVLVLLIAVLLVALAVRLLNQNTAAHVLGPRERAELLGLRELVDDLKQTAWDHRELDSALATIVIDKIRTYERNERERGS